MTTITDTLLKYQKILESLDSWGLLYILDEHDKWFRPEEWVPKERSELDENNKESVIQWIMGTDPILVEGGLIDFLHRKLRNAK